MTVNDKNEESDFLSKFTKPMPCFAPFSSLSVSKYSPVWLTQCRHCHLLSSKHTGPVDPSGFISFSSRKLKIKVTTTFFPPTASGIQFQNESISCILVGVSELVPAQKLPSVQICTFSDFLTLFLPYPQFLWCDSIGFPGIACLSVKGPRGLSWLSPLSSWKCSELKTTCSRLGDNPEAELGLASHSTCGRVALPSAPAPSFFGLPWKYLPHRIYFDLTSVFAISPRMLQQAGIFPSGPCIGQQLVTCCP